jgi:thiamine pyrophosphate-dependent acetolactate synthase large subunit-like protein
MNRRDVIEAFARRRGDAPVIIGPGVSSRMLYETDHRPATIYQMELGYAVPMCLGLAFALPDERVYALDGDGSLLMSLGVLTTIARYRPPNLVVLVLDNRVYLSTGALPSATASGTDLAAIGRGAGLEHAETVADLPALERALDTAAAESGPFLIVSQVEAQDRVSPGGYAAMPFDIVESAIGFRRNLVDRGLVQPLWAI